MILFYSIFTLVFAALYFIYYHLTKNHDYWKKKNVPYEKPSLLFGNYKDYITFKEINGKVAQNICRKFPEAPYIGTFYGTEPALIIKDPKLIKLVMTKDFYYFNYREISQYAHKELINQNMFFYGGDTWNVLRQNFTPLFTSAKLKNMFYIIESCSSSLEATIKREMPQNHTYEMKSLLARYTMDCIGNCAFGINTGTLKDESSPNPFTIIGEKLFDNSNYGGLKLVGRSMWPTIFYKLGFNLMDPQVRQFFDSLIAGVFESRQYQNTSRHDFVDFVLSWKKNNHVSGDSIRNRITGTKETVSLDVDDKLLIAQCVMFFGAGFETTSTTISFLLFELAKHKDAQSRIVEEVDDYFRRHDGKIEYECINELTFLQACVNETLRIYPVLGLITREVAEKYTLPTGLRLEKGTRIHIPVYHLHHNPEYFPKPEQFKPERFFGDEEKKVIPYTFLPFGEGPRICIGLRFAKMPIAAAILTIFKNYTIELGEGMPQKLDFEPRAFATQAKQGINIKFISRKK